VGPVLRWPATRRLVLAVASTSLAAVLASCSASPPGPTTPGTTTPGTTAPGTTAPGTAHPSAASAPAHSSPDPPVPAGAAFTVAGVNPVLPNGSQDTSAQAPGTGCDSATLASDHALGVKIARGFALAGLPVSAGLLQHFLAGSGTPVSYPAG
jgi:hypothetical protein